MNSIELFAGIGGLGMGVAKAGFKQKLAVELDSKCCGILSSNIGNNFTYLKNWQIQNSPIQELDFTSYRNTIDLLTGGPPCQPFSMAGKHSAFRDKRDMFPEAIRAVGQILPKSFLFENVKGLTRERFLNYFEYIKLQLSFPLVLRASNESLLKHYRRLERLQTKGEQSDQTYNVVSRVLNAADYGVPQKRERVFIVGFRSDLHCSWNFPRESHSCSALAKDKLFGSYWDMHDVARRYRRSRMLSRQWKGFDWESVNTAPWSTLRGVVNRYSEFNLCSMGVENHEYRKGARVYKGHTGSLLDEPSKTVKAGTHGVPGGENMLIKDSGSVRYFTIRECAALQTFPDSYVFNGSWSESVKQIGNAVPLELAFTLADSIRTELKKSSLRKTT